MEHDLQRAGLALSIEDSVARITMSRPERRNAMTPRTWTALAHIGHSLPPSVRIVVIGGQGPSFSSGLDLSLFDGSNDDGDALLAAARTDTPENRAALDAVLAECQAGFTWLRRPDIVSIAAVRGHALGAGFQLALACDIRVLAEDAQLAMKEPALGLVPDLTGTKPLVDAVGINRAIEMCLTTRTLGAQEAKELRLAELVVPAADLDGAVADLTAALLATPAAAAAATKELLLSARGNTLADQVHAERAAQVDRLLDLFAT